MQRRREYTSAMNPRLPVATAIASMLAVLISACAPTRPSAPPATAPVQPAAPALRTVLERYVSPESAQDELDSLATWPTEDGHTWLIATAKSTHRLVVFDADERIVRWNRALEDVYGVERADAVGRSLAEVFDEPFVEALRAARHEHPYGATLFRVPLTARRRPESDTDTVSVALVWVLVSV